MCTLGSSLGRDDERLFKNRLLLLFSFQAVTSHPVDQWMQALDKAQVDIDLSGTEFITFVVVSAALGFVFIRDTASLVSSTYNYFTAADGGTSEPITPRRKTLPPQERIKTTRLKLLDKERDKIKKLCTSVCALQTNNQTHFALLPLLIMCVCV